jgi:hypothetical protein
MPSTADGDDANHTRLLAKLDDADMAPGVLRMAVTNDAIGIRWTLPETANESCITAQAEEFALRLAEGDLGYAQLKGERARYDWVTRKARTADQHNRKLAMRGLLNGVVSAFNGLDVVTYASDPRTTGMAFPWSKKVGRMRSLAPTVFALYAIGTDFQAAKPSALVLDVDRLYALLASIDEKDPSLFLKSTLWKVEVADERTAAAYTSAKRACTDPHTALKRARVQ